MGNLGIPELIVIGIIALVAFGPKKLPELGRTLGKALAEFRRASAELRSAVEDEMRDLERHTRELEAQASLETPPEQPPPLPDGPAGSGSIAPSQPSLTDGDSEKAEEKASHPDAKPA